MKKCKLAFLFCFSIIVVFAQTTTFDNLNANPLTNKAITWTSSNYGAGFGHRIINDDPGGFTLLNFQARNNTSAWSNLLTLTSHGRVGIGTTTPSTLLELGSVGRSELTLSGDGTSAINAGIILKANNSSNQRGLGVFMHDKGAANEWYIGRPYSGSDQFVINRRNNTSNHETTTSSLGHNTASQTTTNLFTLKNNGNIGIGTTNPNSKLTIKGDGSGTSALTIIENSGSSVGAHFVSEGGNNIMFQLKRTVDGAINTELRSSGNSYLNTISGNVSIGTTTPYNPQGWHKVLDVHGASHSKIIATSNIAGVKNRYLFTWF